VAAESVDPGRDNHTGVGVDHSEAPGADLGCDANERCAQLAAQFGDLEPQGSY
jgi:hypothetical protein